MKPKLWKNQAFQEGIFFLLLSGALLGYGLNQQNQAFNKDWTQSPYLFPVLVAVLMGILAMCLLLEGIRESGNPSPEAGGQTKGNAGPVLIVLGMSLLYYLALGVLKLPYVTFGILSYSFSVSNFEVATLVFLLAMMLYLGVRRIPVLALVPLGVTLFLSVAFRAMLHVLLP